LNDTHPQIKNKIHWHGNAFLDGGEGAQNIISVWSKIITYCVKQLKLENISWPSRYGSRGRKAYGDFWDVVTKIVKQL